MNGNPQNHNDLAERTSALESWQTGVDSQLSAIRADLSHIADAITKNSKTNWGVIFTGLLLAGGLWAAAIRPLESGQDRVEERARTLAEAVLKQNDRLIANERDLAVGKVMRENLTQDVNDQKALLATAHDDLVLVRYQISEIQRLEAKQK